MKELFMDLETYSSRELARSGVYPYAEDPEFRILLIAYSVDGGPVRQVDLASGEALPKEFLNALTNPSVLKWAYNANFERVCLSRLCRDLNILKWGGEKFLDPESWRCSMVLAAVNGLPLSLADAGAALGLEKQKMTEGKELIRFFCTPQGVEGWGEWDERLSKVRNIERSFPMPHLPCDWPEKWEMFKKYNVRDVETELEIHKALERQCDGETLPDQLWKEYALDQRINDRGVLIDLMLAINAWYIDDTDKERARSRMRRITRLENPGSVQQLQGWLGSRGIHTESLDKETVSHLLEDASLAPEIREVLELRKTLAKTSVSKYQAMVEAMCSDHRVRGTFQFCGASRTGRFSGKLIQLQNLPQNHLEGLEKARRQVVRGCNLTGLQERFGDAADVLSQLIRTAIIPRKGRKFIVCDYSAIEARILSWLAGEKWRMDVFEQGGDIYSASASAMFHVPVEKHGVNSELRQKGKLAELALGYGGATGALKAMGALEKGLTAAELPGLVQRWRNSNQRIVRLWRAVDQAVMKVIKDGREQRITMGPNKNGRIAWEGSFYTYGISETRSVPNIPVPDVSVSNVFIRFWMCGSSMIITLPSGRELVYRDVQLREGRYGWPCVTYMGTNAAKKWERIESYGSKFVENIVQGIARDILCHAMMEMKDRDIVAHVHDEIILEAPMKMTVEEVEEKMQKTPIWAPGLLLKAEGYECRNFYRKE